MSNSFFVATVEEMLELSQAVPGDVATVELGNIDYMKNETNPYSVVEGWQVPAVNTAQAVANFTAGSFVAGVSVNGFTGTPRNADVDAQEKKTPAGEAVGQSQKGEATENPIYWFTDYSAAGNSPIRPANNDVVITVNGIGSTRYSVSSFKFSSAHNQLPTFTAVIDGKASVSGNIPTTPRKPTLSEINEVRNELMKYIYNADVTVAVKLGILSKGDAQFIDINEWIIAGVGNTSINARGSYSVSVVASHPLVLADTVHTTIFNSKALSEPADMDGEANLHLKTIDALTKYVELTKDAEMYEQTDGTELDFTKFARRIEKAISVLQDKMEWNNRGGTDLPLFEGVTTAVGGDINDYFDDMLWRVVLASSNGNHSPLNIIKMFTQPDRGYAIGIDGSFDDLPVVMSPQVFWGSSTGTIYDDEIADMLSPGVSSYPIAGVICPYPMQTSVDPTLYAEYKGYERVDSCGAYLTPAELGEVGPVHRVYLPPWISSYASYVADGADEFPEVDRNTTFYDADDEVAGSREYWKGYAELANAWAKNRFLELYGSGKRCSIQTRLMVSNPNFDTYQNYVRTGENVIIRSRLTNDVLFYFYVLQVEHVIDAQRSQAYTNIVGAYVRPPEGIPAAEVSPLDVAFGLENILYGAKGGLKQ
jgi:hypothetical protein